MAEAGPGGGTGGGAGPRERGPEAGEPEPGPEEGTPAPGAVSGPSPPSPPEAPGGAEEFAAALAAVRLAPGVEGEMLACIAELGAALGVASVEDKLISKISNRADDNVDYLEGLLRYAEGPGGEGAGPSRDAGDREYRDGHGEFWPLVRSMVLAAGPTCRAVAALGARAGELRAAAGAAEGVLASEGEEEGEGWEGGEEWSDEGDGGPGDALELAGQGSPF